MPALRQEDRDHTNRVDTGACERADGIRERRLHQFEVSKSDDVLLGQFGGEAFERPRPFRIARAVREEDDAFLQCSVARRPS